MTRAFSSPPAADPGRARAEIQRMMAGARDKQLLAILQYMEGHPFRAHFDDLIDQVRGRLRALAPRRALTSDRVIVLPFEDLLIPHGDSAPAGHIQRRHLQVLLKLAHHGFDEAEIAALSKTYGGASLSDPQAVLSLGEQVWSRAAEGLTRRPPDGRGGLPRDQVVTAASLLAVAQLFVRRLMELPPRPLPELDDHAAAAVFRTLAEMERRVPGSAALGFRALVARSARPGQLLELLAGSELPMTPPARLALQRAVLTENIDQLGYQARMVACHDATALPAAAETLLLCASRLESLKSLGVPANAKTLDCARRDISAALQTAARTALTSETLTAHMAEIAAGRPAVGRAALDSLETTMRAAGKLRLTARVVATEAEFGKAIQDTAAAIRQSTGQGGAVLHRSAGPREARHFIIQQARLIELLLGPQIAKEMMENCLTQSVGKRPPSGQAEEQNMGRIRHKRPPHRRTNQGQGSE